MIRVPERIRRLVRQRAGNFYEYCKSFSDVTGQASTVDHIYPQAKGGAHDLENLCLCCFWCNIYKQVRLAAFDPRTRKTVPLFHPRRDHWSVHFRWSNRVARASSVVRRSGVQPSARCN